MSGLELIKHTVGGGVMTVSATGGATVSLLKSGKIEFAKMQSGKTVLIKDAFSSAYDNYLLLFSQLHGTGTLNARFRSSTDTGSSSQYVSQFVRADYSRGSALDGNRTSPITQARLINTNSDINGANYPIRGGAHVYVYGPNLGQPTAWRSTTVASTSGGDVYVIDYAGTRNSNNKSTDLELVHTENSPREMAGQLTIYGFTKGTTP